MVVLCSIIIFNIICCLRARYVWVVLGWTNTTFASEAYLHKIIHKTKCSVRMNAVNALFKFFIVLSINSHCYSCVGGSPLRSARDVLKKLGVSSRRMSTTTSVKNAGTATYFKLPKKNGNDDIDEKNENKDDKKDVCFCIILALFCLQTCFFFLLFVFSFK